MLSSVELHCPICAASEKDLRFGEPLQITGLYYGVYEVLEGFCHVIKGNIFYMIPSLILLNFNSSLLEEDQKCFNYVTTLVIAKSKNKVLTSSRHASKVLIRV